MRHLHVTLSVHVLQCHSVWKLRGFGFNTHKSSRTRKFCELEEQVPKIWMRLCSITNPTWAPRDLIMMEGEE